LVLLRRGTFVVDDMVNIVIYFSPWEDIMVEIVVNYSSQIAIDFAKGENILDP